MNNSNICKKCTGSGTICLRLKDWYCEDCLLINVIHKFRSCIGKSKLIRNDEKVLMCISGGPGSMSLLDLVNDGIRLDSHKKLRISPCALHIIESDNEDIAHDCTTAKSIIEYGKSLNIDVYTICMSQYLESIIEKPNANCLPTFDNKRHCQFNATIKPMSASARLDFMGKVKRNLYIRIATILQCKYVFTGDITSTLAANLLTELAIGSGSHIENNIGFADHRDKVKILRPMKDIAIEELNHYIKIKNINVICKNDKSPSNSLQSTIGNFINDLQENYPATIFTVCKIADKVGTMNKQTACCVVCQGSLNIEKKFSALQATHISRIVSNNHGDLEPNNLISSIQQQYTNSTEQSSERNRVCYSCSRNLSEMNLTHLPNHLTNLLK